MTNDYEIIKKITQFKGIKELWNLCSSCVLNQATIKNQY